jgi:hypothetical protein
MIGLTLEVLAGTGFTTVTIYEQDNTVNTIVGTSDISTAGFKDILVVGRSMNDGGDYCKIYTGINNVWTLETSSVGQSYGFDPLMYKLGTAWLMGGFQLFPVASYTSMYDMSVLPSAAATPATFTTTTATVEGNVFAVSGGKLNQIKAGMAAGGDGNYVKAGTGFSNVNGGSLSGKLRVANATNTKDTPYAILGYDDAVRAYTLAASEYYLYTVDNATVFSYPQTDLKSTDNTFLISGKLNDAFYFSNGKLVSDNTGKHAASTGVNKITFGDNAVGANENADVIWDYVGYYNTAAILPQFTTGELHEFACFSGDKNLLGQALYNLGVPVSIKAFCGIQKNYVGEKVIQKIQSRGITASPTTVSITPVILPEMEQFVIGSEIKIISNDNQYNNTAGQWAGINNTIDSVILGTVSTGNPAVSLSQAAPTLFSSVADTRNIKTNFGLHKTEVRWNVSGNTGTSLSINRQMNLEVTA